MPHAFETLIAAELQAQGYTLTQGPSLASKTFPTVVGPKTVTIWLYPPRTSSDPRVWVLWGEYWSEGRNVMSGCEELIPDDADANTVRSTTQHLIQHGEAAILDSYAARLFRRFGPV